MTDTIAPTPERLAKHTDWETPQSDRKTKREHHRVITVVEGMHRRGWLNDEQRDAFARWSRQLERAERIHMPMCQYGRPFVGGAESMWDSVDIKNSAVMSIREACTSIGVPNEIRALTMAAMTETTLEAIGREIGCEGNKTSAITAGKTLLQSGTYRLALHYGFVRGP